jgi:hypothetical protein
MVAFTAKELDTLLAVAGSVLGEPTTPPPGGPVPRRSAAASSGASAAAIQPERDRSDGGNGSESDASDWVCLGFNLANTTCRVQI